MVEKQRSFIERARRVAEEVLYPDAASVDLNGVVPERHWEVLAEEGLYGAAVAGLELSEIARIIEVLSGACLSTAFVWLQHHGAVLSLDRTGNLALRARYLADLTDGRLRAGTAFAGAVANPARLRAERVEGGYLLTGDAPFVSGWGVVDLVQVAARASTGEFGDTVVSTLIEAAPAETLTAAPVDLVAGQATATVRLRFENHFVAEDRLTGVAAYSEFLAFQNIGSRLNGAVACGVADRAIRLLELTQSPETATSLHERLAGVRTELDAALSDPAALQTVRAGAAELALRCAAALVAATGATALPTGQPAQRLLREATFTLVAASRPEMRAALVAGFARV